MQLVALHAVEDVDLRHYRILYEEFELSINSGLVHCWMLLHNRGKQFLGRLRLSCRYEDI
jgi:hypothetical protein